MSNPGEFEATHHRLTAAAAQLQARRDIATGLFTADVSLAGRAQALGFTRETAGVLDLLPAIHVAWADGEVQQPERDAIMAVLDLRGFASGSPAHTLISALLERYPGQVYLDETLAVLRELVADNGARAEALVDVCLAIASAYGEPGDDPIDANERAALLAVGEALGERAHAWLRAKFGDA